jgi:Ca2+/Na+ antiporter
MEEQSKSPLLQKLEKQDLILESSRRSFDKVSKIYNETFFRIFLFIILAYLISFGFLFIEPSYFKYFMILFFSIFAYWIFVLSKITIKSHRSDKRYRKILKEYILNNEKNAELLFKELKANGAKHVRNNTVKNIIEIKRLYILEDSSIKPEDLLIETVNLTNKNKEKNIDLINC